MKYISKIHLCIKSILCSIFSCSLFTDTRSLYDSMLQELKVIVAEIKSAKNQLHKYKQLLEEELIKRDVIIHSMIEYLPYMLLKGIGIL